MYGKSIIKNDYFLKFIYANTKDMNCHLIKKTYKSIHFKKKSICLLGIIYKVIMYYRNWFYLGRKQKMLHVEIKANKKC